MAAPSKQRYDVVVVGGGHNGLVAAAYLARAGLSVLVLERLGRAGGAAVSHRLFPGVPVEVSPHAHLVGPFPDRIVGDLELDVPLRVRRTASFSPVLRSGRHTGLLVEQQRSQVTAESFRRLTGSDHEYDAWAALQHRLDDFARTVAPTLLQPLRTAREIERLVDRATWQMLVEEPVGAAIEKQLADDTVRGLVAADAVLGTFADLRSPGLEQNRSFVHHALGRGNGGWRVPVGGMGSVTRSLERAVRRADGEVVTGAFVTRVESDGRSASITFRADGAAHTVDCSWVVGNVAPWVMRLLLGEDPGPRPEGAQIKVEMVLDRLPRLRTDVSPPTAFAGTVHFAQGYDELQDSYRQARGGDVPVKAPGQLHCHSLTDPSVMGALAVEGKHTFSYVGVHTPARLFVDDLAERRDEAVLRALDAINLHLEEPIETLLSLDRDGRPCLLAKAPQDVELELAMPGGHWSHGPPTWPWAPDTAVLDTAARRWGVQTPLHNVLLCGAGAVRGGAVSGIGGHNAAMAVLEATGVSS